MEFIQKLPAKYSTKIYYATAVGRVLFTVLTGTVYGSFGLLLTIYLGLFLTPYKPYLPSQLALYVNDLPSEYKIAIIASLITILGFLFAFHSANIAWKRQAVANLQIAAANDIHELFIEAIEAASNLSAYAGGILAFLSQIDPSGIAPKDIFAARYILSQQNEKLELRTKLGSMSVKVHTLSSRHFTSLAGVPSAASFFKQAAGALTEISNNMWFMVPIVDQNDPKIVEKFVALINREQIQKFVNVCEEKMEIISGIAVGLKVLLTASLNEPSLRELRGFLQSEERKQLVAAFDLLHRDYKSRLKKPR